MAGHGEHVKPEPKRYRKVTHEAIDKKEGMTPDELRHLLTGLSNDALIRVQTRMGGQITALIISVPMD